MKLDGLASFAFLTLPSYSMIAVAGAIEVLRMANRISGTECFRWQLVSPDGVPVPSSNGAALHPTLSTDRMARPDLLFVCGGVDVRDAVDSRVTMALRHLARDGVPLGGLCTGSFALAAAGLLRGRTCAIHWENLAAIQEEFPDIEFVRDLYAVDRDRVTCSGGVAPLSLMLAVVAARFGPAMASAIQAQFLVERAREGTEQQHARPGPAGHPKLESAVHAIEAADDGKLPTAELARSVGLSPRQLERLFRRHLGQTPAAYAAGLRLDRARALLRDTALPITTIATTCGYVTPSRFSAAYRGRFGRSPRDDRAHKQGAHKQGAHKSVERGDDAHQHRF